MEWDCQGWGRGLLANEQTGCGVMEVLELYVRDGGASMERA